MAKSLDKIEARRFRRKGRSIKDIAKLLGVSKSTVSLWCSDIELTQKQIEALHRKMVKASYKGRLKGARVQKQRRLQKISHYQKEGGKDIGIINDRDLLLFGLGLYLGEGNKHGNNFQFVNSSPDVIRIMIRWLRLFGIGSKDFYCNIIINEVHHKRISDVQKRWMDITGFSHQQFKKTVLIKSVSKKVYENHNNHLGTFILRVYKSSDLLYKVLGLMDGAIRKANKRRPA